MIKEAQEQNNRQKYTLQDPLKQTFKSFKHEEYVYLFSNIFSCTLY